MAMKVKNWFLYKSGFSSGIMAPVKMYSISAWYKVCVLDSVLILYLDVLSAGTGHNPSGVHKLDKQ